MTGMRSIPGVILLLLLLLGASCSKKGLDAMYSKQEENIESIVTDLTQSDSSATVTHAGGTTRVTVVHGEGTPLSANGKVQLYYAGHLVSGSSLNGSNLFRTNHPEYAANVGWSVTDTTVFTPVWIDLSGDGAVEGLAKGLPGVRPGDECYVLFSGKTAFGKGRTGSIPAHSALAYHLWILDVVNK